MGLKILGTGGVSLRCLNDQNHPRVLCVGAGASGISQFVLFLYEL